LILEHRKLKVAILFGGKSAEHDVSRASAANVLRYLDPEIYETFLVGITREGHWIPAGMSNHLGTDAIELIVPKDGPHFTLIPGGRGRAVLIQDAGALELFAFDIVFPVLHGPHGEDGTVQGALELADVPYVGSGVIGSAAAMDKDVAKRLMREAGLPTARFVSVSWPLDIVYEDATRAVGSTDLFVKPANMGSSVGVSIARSAQEYRDACEQAFKFDSKILIEECVPFAREIECSVLQDAHGDTRASELGEIAPAGTHGFYSYDAKYIKADGATLVVPAKLPREISEEIKSLAIKTFKTLCCEGMARIDFFLAGQNILVNEANTLPGFTSISMYPKLWMATGMQQNELMNILIEHALARYQRKKLLSVYR
jgi:D-alanine-D-alanine ligase